MGSSNGEKEHHSFTEKLKHPFHEMKEKLEHTHLHDTKVRFIHKK